MADQANPQNPNPGNFQNPPRPQNQGTGSTPPPQAGVQGGMNPQAGGVAGAAGMPPQYGGYQAPVNPQPQGYSPQPPMGMGGMAQPPQGGFGGQPMPPPPPPVPEDTTPANFKLGTRLPKVIGVKIPAHTLKFDEQLFLHLLAGSISLTKDEKMRIVESIPKLKQSQVDELIRIFEEERRKFAELPAKHVEQLKKLEQQHFNEWNDLELGQKANEKKNQDQAKADEIRKKLGL